MRPGLRSYLLIRAAEELGAQMLNVAIGWYLYAATRNPMSLAYVGIAQFVPNLCMLLVAGQAADRFDRRKLIGLSVLVQTICLGSFTVWFATRTTSTLLIYFLLVVMGASRAFSFPAMSATLPHAVDAQEFPRAVAAASSTFQVSSIVGPAIGGVIYAFSATAMFATATCLYLFATIQSRLLPVGHRTAADKEDAPADRTIFAGIRYIRSNRLLLSLISLDLFAVLLGGVTALLPIYARDILAVGPIGLGALRCAPGVGAAIVGLFLAHRTIQRGAGKLMLGCVSAFGVSTIVFAISKNIWLSLGALALAGGFDMVSVVIRQTLVQLSTPDAMRGRVSAVNWAFIGASSELGEFESGVTARLFGTVPAALIGGIGTLVVVALWARIFPELPQADQLVWKDA